MKNSRKYIITSFLILATLFAGALRAEELAVTLDALKVTRDHLGAEVLVVADSAEPGAIIEYRAVCKNITTSVLNNVFTEIPVPEGLVWLASSAQPVATEARLANGQLVPFPALDADGQPLPAAQIRGLRWKLESIAAGESIVVLLRASVAR